MTMLQSLIALLLLLRIGMMQRHLLILILLMI